MLSCCKEVCVAVVSCVAEGEVRMLRLIEKNKKKKEGSV